MAADLPPRPNVADVRDALAGPFLIDMPARRVLAAEVLHLRAQLDRQGAELAALRGKSSGTDWGVQWSFDGLLVEHDEHAADGGEAQARMVAELYRNAQYRPVLVRRELGPWVPAQ